MIYVREVPTHVVTIFGLVDKAYFGLSPHKGSDVRFQSNVPQKIKDRCR